MPFWNTAILLVVLHALFGAILGLLLDYEGAVFVVQAVQVVVIAGVVFAWATFDARGRGRELGTLQGICIAAFGYLAVPFYLGSYRPNSSWLRWLVKGSLLFLTCMVVFLVTAVIAATLALL